MYYYYYYIFIWWCTVIKFNVPLYFLTIFLWRYHIIESRPCIMIDDRQLIIKRQYIIIIVYDIFVTHRKLIRHETYSIEIRHVQTTNTPWVVTSGYRTKMFFLKYWSRPRRRSVQCLESRSLRIICFIISPSCAVYFSYCCHVASWALGSESHSC